MRSKEPGPDRNYSGDQPEQELPGQHPDSKQDLWARPSLTIAEAAQLCGVSASTIRRHLAAGRFPTAHQQPSPIPGQRGLWRIPTRDLLAAGLRPRQVRRPDPEEDDRPSRQAVGQPGDDRVRELEYALELERTRRRAAEDLAAERAHTIQTLERALGALQAHHNTAPTPSSDRAALLPASPSDATYGRPAPRSGMLPMVPKRRRAKRELSQEEKAAIIGRALSRQRPPKRRWP
jgi:Helix-turn-helix domain